MNPQWFRVISVYITTIMVLLLGACKVPPQPNPVRVLSGEIVVVHNRDCVWLLNTNENAITNGPFCFSTFWKQVEIGDVKLDTNGLLYISITTVWNPEKGSGNSVIIFDPLVNKIVSEITTPPGPQALLVIDNTLYVGLNISSTIIAIDLQSKYTTQEISLNNSCPIQTMIHDTDGLIYVNTCDTLIAVDPTTNRIVSFSWQYSSYIYDISQGSNGNLYVLLSDSIQIVDPNQEWSIVKTWPLTACQSPRYIIVTELEGYVTCADEKIIFLDLEENRDTLTVPLPHYYTRVLAINDDAIYLHNGNNSVVVLNLSTGNVDLLIDLPDKN